MKPPAKTHNHVPKAIAFLAGKNFPPKLHLLTIAHDDWCDMISGRGCCNCDPEFKVRMMPKPEDN